ncbi:hypothetical protein LCGC14_2732980 [marine sediment metagenome]|uniref:Uncharacterized protein n=1 Tax=marine sediment metagenome TaxID=412755 RepID=A0A0F8ZU23_9ZZZZ
MVKAQYDLYLSDQTKNWGEMGQVIFKGNLVEPVKLDDCLWLVYSKKRYTEEQLCEKFIKSIKKLTKCEKFTPEDGFCDGSCMTEEFKKEKQGCGKWFRYEDEDSSQTGNCMEGNLCPSCSTQSVDDLSHIPQSPLSRNSVREKKRKERPSVTRGGNTRFSEDKPEENSRVGESSGTFNLSDKIWNKDMHFPFLNIEDVKTFIAQLKKVLDKYQSHMRNKMVRDGKGHTRLHLKINKEIDKLSGEKLWKK